MAPELTHRARWLALDAKANEGAVHRAEANASCTALAKIECFIIGWGRVGGRHIAAAPPTNPTEQPILIENVLSR